MVKKFTGSEQQMAEKESPRDKFKRELFEICSGFSSADFGQFFENINTFVCTVSEVVANFMF